MTGVAAGSVDVVVVAAGSSTRMAGVDKLLAPLMGRPLLAWSLDAVRRATATRGLVLVAAPERVDALEREPWIVSSRAQVVAGGPRRQDSVAAGVAATASEVVLVHDGARPLVRPSLVDRVAQASLEHGAAVPGWPVVETLKRVHAGRIVETVDRHGLVAAQTPQGGRRAVLMAAFAELTSDGREVTDEGALLESAGVPVVVVDGDPDNLKVTTPADLARAEAILAAHLGSPHIGQGHDSHPFGPDDGLALGGIRIDEAPALAGHSDGDAALHAITDALLAATGGGDLGRRFPSGDPSTRGVDSRALLAAVVNELAEAGWQPIGIDVLIRGARPQLGAARLDAMRDSIAGLVGTAISAVAVHASSGNLDGPDGAGRSISASAVVQVVRR
jgi:2-C-methyl-D-erythritol 4-phosphate cytidylyltransferase / 2-C-methyl-D-erythritol 2,4-cyclodiphosphate synthase